MKTWLIILLICIFVILIIFLTIIISYICKKKESLVYPKKGLGVFDKIIYINLDHRKDRNKEFLNEMKKYKINTRKIHRISALYTPNNGAKGCAYSHMQAIKYAMDNKLENVVIMEDDIEFILDPSIYIDKFLKDFGNDWDVLMLHYRSEKLSKSVNNYLQKTSASFSALGYIVNKSMFQRLYKIFEESYHNLDKDTFYLKDDKGKFCIDRNWIKLQPISRWYQFEKNLSENRESFSDIEQRHQESG